MLPGPQKLWKHAKQIQQLGLEKEQTYLSGRNWHREKKLLSTNKVKKEGTKMFRCSQGFVVARCKWLCVKTLVCFFAFSRPTRTKSSVRRHTQQLGSWEPRQKAFIPTDVSSSDVPASVHLSGTVHTCGPDDGIEAVSEAEISCSLASCLLRASFVLNTWSRRINLENKLG